MTASPVPSRSFTAGRRPAWWAGSSALSCVTEATRLLTGALGGQYWEQCSPAHWGQGSSRHFYTPHPLTQVPHHGGKGSSFICWLLVQKHRCFLSRAEAQDSILRGDKGQGFHEP